jgi:sialidase-1
MPSIRFLDKIVMIRLLLAASCGLLVDLAARAEIAETTVYQSGQEGYHTFRIPAVVAAQNGELLAFAEGRKNGPADHGDIDIVVKHSTDGGKSWSRLRVVADEWENPTAKVTIGNPVPIVDRTDSGHPGRMWLAFTRNNAAVLVTYSDDNGQTWSKGRDITTDGADPSWSWYATGPGHGIQLERGPHAGRFIVPSDHRIAARDSWGAHILYSDDHGETWKVGAVDTCPGESPLHPNENLAVELVDGCVYVNARDQHGADPATRAIAFSSDGGESFDKPFAAEPDITTPVVQNSVLRLTARDRGDARNVLVYSCPGHPAQRRDLTILLSTDEGRSWQDRTLIHPGPAAYSDLVKLDSDRVGVLFEAGAKLYDQIIFASLTLDDLADIRSPAN